MENVKKAMIDHTHNTEVRLMEHRQDAEAQYYPDCKTFNCQADLDTEKTTLEKDF